LCNGTDTLLCIDRRTELESDSPVWSLEEARYFTVLTTLQVLLPVVRHSQYSHLCVTLAAVGRITEGVLFWCLRVTHCDELQYHMAYKQRSPQVWHQTL